MENNFKKEYFLPKEIAEKLKEEGLDISNLEVCDLIEEKRQYHYWYGGQVAKVQYKDAIFSIEASGDVNFKLIRKEDDSQLFYVKDKENRGSLYHELCHYIKDDEEFQKLLDNEHPDYYAEIDNNNWWECFVTIGGVFYDLMWCLDADTIEEAIGEVYTSLDEMYDYIQTELV